MNLYVISGVTGMTGNELARQLVEKKHKVIGFDNFFASSVKTIADIVENPLFDFYEYDLNNIDEMEKIKRKVVSIKKNYNQTIYVNCAAIVHTEHFY